MSEELAKMQEQLNRIEQYSVIAAKKVLNIDEVTFITGFNKHHIYELTMRKEIPHSKRGGRLFFDKTKVEDWLLEHDNATDEDIEIQAKNYITRKNAQRGRAMAGLH